MSQSFPELLRSPQGFSEEVPKGLERLWDVLRVSRSREACFSLLMPLPIKWVKPWDAQLQLMAARLEGDLAAEADARAELDRFCDKDVSPPSGLYPNVNRN